MIGIITAMDIEMEYIISQIKISKEDEVAGIRYICGTIGETDVVVAKCGIGKVAAAQCAQILISRYGPGEVVNVGVAGGLRRDVTIGSVAICTEVVQHDVDTTAFGDPIGMISGYNMVYFPCDSRVQNGLTESADLMHVPYHAGVIATGDQFIDNTDKKSEIVSHFNAIACEMEGGAIGQVCYANRVPFGILRAISDGGDEDAGYDYAENLNRAALLAAQIAVEFVKRTKEQV